MNKVRRIAHVGKTEAAEFVERRVWLKRKLNRGTGMETQSSRVLDAGLIRLREVVCWSQNGDAAAQVSPKDGLGAIPFSSGCLCVLTQWRSRMR